MGDLPILEGLLIPTRPWIHDHAKRVGFVFYVIILTGQLIPFILITLIFIVRPLLLLLLGGLLLRPLQKAFGNLLHSVVEDSLFFRVAVLDEVLKQILEVLDKLAMDLEVDESVAVLSVTEGDLQEVGSLLELLLLDLQDLLDEVIPSVQRDRFGFGHALLSIHFHHRVLAKGVMVEIVDWLERRLLEGLLEDIVEDSCLGLGFYLLGQTVLPQRGVGVGPVLLKHVSEVADGGWLSPISHWQNLIQDDPRVAPSRKDLTDVLARKGLNQSE